MIDGVLFHPVHSFRDLDLNTGADLEFSSARMYCLRENADAYDSPEQYWVDALQGSVEFCR